MNNIRKSLEILFKNQNPEELIDKFFNPFISKRITEEIDSNVFQCLFSFQNKNLYNMCFASELIMFCHLNLKQNPL